MVTATRHSRDWIKNRIALLKHESRSSMVKLQKADSQPHSMDTEMAEENANFLEKSKSIASDIASTAKAASQITFKKAEQTKITNVYLPKAFLTLGQHVYKAGHLRDVLTEQYKRIDELEQKIAILKKQLEERSSGQKTSDKAKVLAASAKDKAQIKALQFNTKQEFVKLGKAAFTAEGVNSGPAEIVNHIAELKDRHAALSAEISSLNSSGKTSIFSPQQFAVGVLVVLGLAVSLSAYSFFARGNGSNQRVFKDDKADTVNIASINEGDNQNQGVGSDQPVPKTSKGEFKEIDRSKKFPSQTPDSVFDEIVKAEIPFELQTPDIPKEVVKLYPATAKVLSDGRFVGYNRGGDAYLDDLKDGTSTRLRNQVPRSVSPSGRYVYGVGENFSSLCEITSRGLNRLLECSSNTLVTTTFDGIPAIPNESAINDPGSFSPKETFFVATASHGYGINEPSDILLVSIAQRRVVQKISNVMPPLKFSDDELRLYCRDTQGYLMMYEWDGKQYAGKQKWDADLYHYHATNALFLSATAMRKDGTNQWGFAVWDYTKSEPQLISSKPLGLEMCGGPVGGALISYEKNQGNNQTVPSNPFHMNDDRVAWITLECDESENFQKRWLYYANIKDALIKKYPLPFGVNNGLVYGKPQGPEIIGLDYSGRYAFLKGLVKDRVAVYRLESQ